MGCGSVSKPSRYAQRVCVCVVTEDEFFAGTDGEVCIVLTGQGGKKTPPLRCKSSRIDLSLFPKQFEAGSKDFFLFYLEEAIGEVTKLTLVFKNSRLFGDWKVKHVCVTNFCDRTQTLFDLKGQWLNKSTELTVDVFKRWLHPSLQKLHEMKKHLNTGDMVLHCVRNFTASITRKLDASLFSHGAVLTVDREQTNGNDVLMYEMSETSLRDVLHDTEFYIGLHAYRFDEVLVVSPRDLAVLPLSTKSTEQKQRSVADWLKEGHRKKRPYDYIGAAASLAQSWGTEEKWKESTVEEKNTVFKPVFKSEGEEEKEPEKTRLYCTELNFSVLAKLGSPTGTFTPSTMMPSHLLYLPGVDVEKSFWARLLVEHECLPPHEIAPEHQAKIQQLLDNYHKNDTSNGDIAPDTELALIIERFGLQSAFFRDCLSVTASLTLHI